MMAWTHALIGAAIGSKSKTNAAAYTGGVVSHGLADLIPHRDYEMKVELPLLALAMIGIVVRYGFNSKEFWGAVGGFSPDIENGLAILGILPKTIFPTHTEYPWFVGHGHKIKSVLPQVAIAIICFWIIEQARQAPEQESKS